MCSIKVKPLFSKLYSFCKHMVRYESKCIKYSPKIEAAINNQIQIEQQASQGYLSLAMSFLHPLVSCPGVGGFFMNMYEEEVEHMQYFIQYQFLRGGTPMICGLNAPEHYKKITILDAFKKALVMEQQVTKVVEKLVQLAESEKDIHCADFVTSKFLTEQVKSLNDLTYHISKLKRLSSDENALYHYDKTLEKTHPYSFKKILKL